MAKPEKKRKAIILRRQGMSMKEISSLLDVSKGSVSVWCQDVILTDQQTRLLKKKQIESGNEGRQIGANKNKEKRLQAIRLHNENALTEIGILSDRDLFILGIGLE